MLSSVILFYIYSGIFFFLSITLYELFYLKVRPKISVFKMIKRAVFIIIFWFPLFITVLTETKQFNNVRDWFYK